MDFEIIAVATELALELERLGIPYLVGGSVASSILGERRPTHDIDLAVDLRPDQVPSLVAALEGRYYADESAIREAIRNRSCFNVIHLGRMVKVDLFVLGEGTFDRQQLARAKAVLVSSDPERELVISAPEDLILRKLDWYRRSGGVSDRQWRDVLGVLKAQAGSIDLGYLMRSAEELRLTEILNRALTESGAAPGST